MKRIITIFLMMFSLGSLSAQPGTYYQKTQRHFPLPADAGADVLRLFGQERDITAVTTMGVFRYRDGGWNGKKSSDRVITATLDATGGLWLALSPRRNGTPYISRFEGTEEIALPPTAANDKLLCLFWEDAQTLHVGTSGGLLTWNGKWHAFEKMKGIRVNNIALDADKQLWVATTDGLWRRSGSKWVNLDDVLMAEGNDRHYYALAIRNNGKDLLFSSPLSIGCIASDGDHWIWRGPDGLPYGPATVIRTIGQDVWIGTEKGVIHRDSTWHYYHGKRWLPDERVNDILPLNSTKAWIATPNGISEITRVPMTLEQKAAIFEEVIEARHNRRGLVNTSHLRIAGDLSTSYSQNEDNDGLWTACYLLAESYRYAVTKDPEAKQLAVRTFEALERLETVTGISGYPARSYATASDKVVQSRSPHPKFWRSSPDGKWQWLDDTSSDEITGHMFSLSVFYELVADDAQKKRIRDLIERIVSHIVDNGYQLIDFDGKPTRWGIWTPDSLNDSPRWAYERGLNSLQILSHLKTALHFTGNQKFGKAYEELVSRHGYARNAVQAKIYGPFETSHSDDILNFFPYYGLMHYSGNDENRHLFVKSLERSWRAVEADRMPVWNVIASALLKRDCGLDVALEELRDYPIDLINWSVENSHRWDLVRDPLVDRGRRPQAIYPIRPSESGIYRWNTNPKRFDGGGGGMTEETGTDFLAAYWMGRYYGFWPQE